jgi:hypothetical protein
MPAPTRRSAEDSNICAAYGIFGRPQVSLVCPNLCPIVVIKPVWLSYLSGVQREEFKLRIALPHRYKLLPSMIA